MTVVWPNKTIGELADITRGSSPRPIVDTRYFEGGTIPWVKIADATKSGKFLIETKEHVSEFGASSSKRLPPGTILVAASGTLGYTQILGVEACAHDGWLMLQNLRELDRDFAYYALKTKARHFFNSGSGAAIQNMACLLDAARKYGKMPFGKLKSLSHKGKAFENADANGEMKLADLIDELRDSEAISSHLKDRNPGEAHAKGDSALHAETCAV